MVQRQQILLSLECGNLINILGNTVLSGIIKGIFHSLWIVGSAMLILQINQTIGNRFKGKNRWRTFEGNSPRISTSFSLKESPILKKFVKEIDFAEIKFQPGFIFALMVIMTISAFWGIEGAIYLLKVQFATGSDRLSDSGVWIISLCTSILFGSIPYFYVHFKVQRKRHRISVRMIALVQNIIGNYNHRLTMLEVIRQSEETMPEDVRGEWSRLSLSLSIKKIDEALYEFADRIGNKWAEDLADMLLIASEHGSDITDSLKRLVQRMQTEKTNEDSRLAMITVFRIGTTILVISNFIVIFVNIWLDGANYHAYFIDPTGKLLIVLSIIVMFVSMILVIRSGKKQF
ncbi:hypothetical protein B0G52_118145 [Cohnella sp. SGD-V74]|nr:hypothetical protein B0G52_118145 [Cohnella sp. SGD-V74]